jgi:transposase
LPYWSESNAAKFLGAVSDDGRTFFSEVNSRFTSDVTVHFLQALQNEFGDRLHVVLDNAVYFASNKVAEFVDNSKLEVTSLPTGSPDLNPVEECWRQFKRQLGNRFFQSIDELRTDALDALDEITPPDLLDYFCP